MVRARKDHDKEPVADNAASDLSRLAEASSKLFAEQTAAMAVMTAYGMTVAAQMTGMMLGAFRGPASAEGVEEPASAERVTVPAQQTAPAKVVPLRPETLKASETKPAPVAEVAAKPARRAAKSVKAKTAPVRTKAAPFKMPEAKPARRARATSAKPASTTGGDDLKKISGIGPRLEQELNARRITRYADIAALSKAAVKKLDDELGLDGRIAKDDWAGQAKALSGGKG